MLTNRLIGKQRKVIVIQPNFIRLFRGSLNRFLVNRRFGDVEPNFTVLPTSPLVTHENVPHYFT